MLCQKWQWYQPNGQMKDMDCREVLVTLERQDHLQFPHSRHNRQNDIRNRTLLSILVDQSPIVGSLGDYDPVTITMVWNTPLESLYNSLVHQYHYLGYRQIVGQHLKYMAFLGDRPVACIGWGSSAWAVKVQEIFIATIIEKRNVR